MNKTGIDYLTHTWNPIAMRCSPISPGCDNCWHLAMCKRHAANPAMPPDVRAARAGGPPVLVTDELSAPLRRRKPATIGVQFMGDFFHPKVTEVQRIEVLEAMLQAPQHRYLLLTKRAKAMAKWWEKMYDPPPNLGQGVTVEDQQRADERIPILLNISAAMRFVSIEPMLSEVDLRHYLGGSLAGRGLSAEEMGRLWGAIGLSWIIAGGETGPGARPMHPNWVRSIRDQCQAAGVPYFFKGWAQWAPFIANGPLPKHCRYIGRDGAVRVGDMEETTDICMGRVGKKRAGRLLDGVEWNQFPQWGDNGR